jgi:hypothetical protein
MKKEKTKPKLLPLPSLPFPKQVYYIRLIIAIYPDARKKKRAKTLSEELIFR